MTFSKKSSFAYLIWLILAASHVNAIEVNFWYGDQQYFGYPGKSQAWVNILGTIKGSSIDQDFYYRVNDNETKPLSLGSDLHRLASQGDFNIDLKWDGLGSGNNRVSILHKKNNEFTQVGHVDVSIEADSEWPLPYSVDFSDVAELQKEVQVVDGYWKLTPEGIRTALPFYDRVICLGDKNWKNYESVTELTVHRYIKPRPGPPTYNVTHFGVSLYWHGHQLDNLQPHRKWYPLGAQGELLLRNTKKESRWRVLRDRPSKLNPIAVSRPMPAILLNKRLLIRARVQSIDEKTNLYRFKKWQAHQKEPQKWQISVPESKETDFSAGALCLVAHNSDVTIHKVDVKPVQKP